MAIIDYINAQNKTYQGMKRVLSYIMNPEKTEPHLISGCNCDPENAYHEFILTKSHFHKETGRQFIHFLQSFAPYENITPEMAHEIAGKLLGHEMFRGFQVVCVTHTDKAHFHTHFVVNTVNAETGLKWKQSREQLQMLKDHSDEICKAHGLLVVDGEKGRYKTRGQYRSEAKGQSWKYELFLAVKQCKWCSANKEDFISNMEKLGYNVSWTDKRKYITFTTPEGKKCRNRKLYPPEQFTKEALLKAFELNKQQATEKQLHDKMEFLLSSIYILSQSNNCQISKHYPLSTLKGEALRDEIAELKKGSGLDWDKEGDRDM